MVVELFLDLLSQPCRALFIFAKKNNIPFELKHVDLLKGQHMTEEFDKVNALRKVPALRDGAFTLAESTAILLYLSRKFKTPDHWYPSDLQKRARVDEYLSWQHTAIRAAGCKVYLSKVLLPLITGKPFCPEKVERAIEELNVALKQFEEKFLEDKPFIAGSEISLADLVAVVEIMQPVGAGYEIFKPRPKLAEWQGRVEEAIGKELFQEAHEQVLNAKSLSVAELVPELREQMACMLLKLIN
ncbi:glutathione S-transferase theta-2B [Alligator sinensis]|uniref:glutathione transferase n=1 Tax=Alligator sinensis TaxID=38654 RepID=A0A1U7RKX5_ALLSI|nr:glutathione S-transferase theta-2B [Alligator sinensis]